jgi:hypothetical protein
MQKVFTIFLLAAMMCVSVCGCSDATASQSPTPVAVKREVEDADAVATALLYIGDANALETTRPTKEITKNAIQVMHYTEDEVVMMAKLLQRECGGLPSVTEQACVAWTVCNRVDSDEFDGDTIAEIITARYQFAYYYSTPVIDELYELALDVLTRWNAERNGEVSVGRVLPKDYTYFVGDGVHNYFRNAYKGDYSIWDYSLPSPYES